MSWFKKNEQPKCEHHWHEIKDSFRKIKHGGPQWCAQDPDTLYYYRDYFNVCWTKVTHLEECCLCLLQKEIRYETVWDKSAPYPDLETNPLPWKKNDKSQ